MDWAIRFSLSRLIFSYSMLLQMWEVVTEKDGIEVSYLWFGTKDKKEAFVYNKLATAVDLNTKAAKRMVSLLRTNGGR